MSKDGLKLPIQRRHESFRAQRDGTVLDDVQKDSASPLDTEKRTLALTFSSETPVDRWWGREILSHDPAAARLERLNDGAPLLFNHDMDRIIGVVESAGIGDDRRGHAVVRFARTPAGDEAMSMVADGIMRNVSFAYRVMRATVETEGDEPDADDTWTATDWEAYEISLVSVPADASIGVGRAEDGKELDVIVERSRPNAAAAANVRQENTMTDSVTQKQPDTGAAAASAPVNIEAVRNAAAEEATANERARIDAISTYGEKLGLRDLAGDLIKSGKTVDQARQAFLERVQSVEQKPLAKAANIDLSAREAKSFSLVRAIQAAVNGDWTKAGLEREVSVATAQQRDKLGLPANSSRSIFLPTNLPFAVPGADQRAIYQVGTAIQGGNLVATQLLAGSFIEVLRNMSVTAQLGATMLTGLVSNVDIPRQTAATGTFWVAESGAITEAEATFDKVSLRPKTIGALSKMSRLMLLQATPDIEMIARNDLLAVIALGMDLAALSGSGASNQPTGIINQSGVGSVVGGTNGANVTFDHIISLYSTPRIANAPQSNLGFAINAKTYGYLSSQKSSTGQYLWMPQGGVAQAPADTLRGYRYAVSQQLRSNLTKGTSSGICSELIFGNWAELLIGEWGSLELAINPYDSTGFANGDVIIRAFQTCDIQLRHGASFAVMSDALTPGF